MKTIFNEIFYLYNAFLKKSDICTDPIFVFGNQKSGTSAISALVSRAAGLELTLDFRVRSYIYKDFYRVLDGAEDIKDFIRCHPLEFSREVIKEPNLSLIPEKIFSAFPNARSIYVVRHPLSNIRSILERLGLSAGASVHDIGNVNFVWKKILTGEDLPSSCVKTDSVFENLLARWVYIDGEVSKFNPEIVKYEDFNSNKKLVVEDLVARMGLDVVGDYEGFLDVQYQPRGKRASNLDFFDDEHFHMLKNAGVSDVMLKYDYE